MARFPELRDPHRRRRYSLLLVIAVMSGFLPHTASAQILPPVIDPSGRSGEPPFPERQQPPPKAPPQPEILPPVETPELQRHLEPGPLLRVFVSSIEVLGSTVFSSEELAQVTAQYENREVTTEDLEELRRTLTLMYVNKGYANSGAVLPDQSLIGGVVHYHVIEGRLSEIRVDGTRWFRSSYLKDRISLGITRPFNMNPLRDRLQLVLQDQRLERVNAQLNPGDRLGEARLDVHVQEANPFRAYLEFNNYITPVVGENQLRGTVAHRNLTGNGDILSVTFGASAGVSPWEIGVFPTFDASYAIPLNRYDTTFFAGYRIFDFTVIEAPFTPLDIESKTQIWTFSLRQPVYRTLTDEVALTVMGEYEQNGNTLLGEPFDIVPGMQQGYGNVAALRFIPEWTHRTPSSVFSVRSRFTVGLDVLGATISHGPEQASGQFFSWSGQAEWLRRFESTGIELGNFMNLQFADHSLFPLEQMAVGGRYTVRGYREITLLRDNAFTYSLEVHLPLWTSKSGYDILRLAPFVDVGRAWNTKRPTPDPETLASVGVGLLVNPSDRAYASIYWGQQLNHVPAPAGANTLQDHGIHIQFVWNLF